MRAGALFLCLAAVLLAAAGRPCAAEPLPAGTGISTGAPPLVPEVPKERRPGWASACIASGRRQAGTRAGGDLLYAAGIVLARELGRPERALAVLDEASITYPDDEAFRGLVHLDAAELRLSLGDAPGAERSLGVAKAWARHPAPVDADTATLGRFALLAERVATHGTRLGVRIAESTGDFASAAAQQEHIAADRALRGRPGSDEAWARAARLHKRAGNDVRAMAAVDRALELTDGDASRADLTFWRLYLKHGLLDEQAAPSLGTGWPGDAFEMEIHATLGGLQGIERVGVWLLTLASRAVTADRDGVALDLYAIALRDPALLDRARVEPAIRDGLLVAFPVALRLGRLEVAERVLETVAGAANLPRTELDAYRLALARTRANAAREPPQPAPPAPPEPVEDAPSPSPHRGRLYPHGPPKAGECEDRSVPVETDEAVRTSAPVGPLLGLSAGLGLALYALVAARRRRRRASLGGYSARR